MFLLLKIGFITSVKISTKGGNLFEMLRPVYSEKKWGGEGGEKSRSCIVYWYFQEHAKTWTFSTVILSLPLIQEGQLSVSGKRMCTILVNRLED